MTQRSIGNTRPQTVDDAHSDRYTSSRGSGVMPHSYVGEQRSGEGHLIQLALRLCDVPNLDDACRDALSTLSTLLPNFRVSVESSTDEAEPTRSYETPSYGAMRNPLELEYVSEWPLDDHPDLPRVVLKGLRQCSQQERTAAVTTTERVVTLLNAALHRARTVQQLDNSREEATRLRAQIMQAEKLASYGQAVAGVLHDLNNPLTAIVAYSDYLNRSLRTQNVTPADLERLTRIREAAERALHHTRSLVEYARPAHGPFVKVDLAHLVRSALVFCEHALQTSKMHVVVSLDNLEHSVFGIPGQLTQAFVNLITNAAHAARAESAELRIEAAYDADGRHASISLHDNGVGIRHADLKFVFDPFFTTKSNGSGFGLGLAIVKDIVSAHGGSIHVESAPDVGTTFRVSLPVVLGGSPKEAAPSS